MFAMSFTWPLFLYFGIAVSETLWNQTGDYEMAGPSDIFLFYGNATYALADDFIVPPGTPTVAIHTR